MDSLSASVSAHVSSYVVDAAEQALRHFGDDLSRAAAERLLSMWRFEPALSRSEREALLDRFGQAGGAREPAVKALPVRAEARVMTGQQQPRHPAWCDRSRCTVDTDPVSGQHRSEVEPTVRLRACAHLARAERTRVPRTFVHVEVDTALHGLAQLALTTDEARELGRFLVVMAARGEYDTKLAVQTSDPAGGPSA